VGVRKLNSIRHSETKSKNHWTISETSRDKVNLSNSLFTNWTFSLTIKQTNLIAQDSL